MPGPSRGGRNKRYFVSSLRGEGCRSTEAALSAGFFSRHVVGEHVAQTLPLSFVLQGDDLSEALKSRPTSSDMGVPPARVGWGPGLAVAGEEIKAKLTQHPAYGLKEGFVGIGEADATLKLSLAGCPYAGDVPLPVNEGGNVGSLLGGC